jgi:transmembrane 9 superfamily protein 1
MLVISVDMAVSIFFFLVDSEASPCFLGCVLGASEQPFPRLQKIRHARLIDHTGDWFYCATARMKYALMICSGCSETYQYYDMPFCSPTDVKHKSEDLGEVLEGDRMVTTLYNVTFKTNKTSERLCSFKLNPKDISKFKTAVEQDYYFQMFFDDLPLWGFIGKIQEEKQYLLFTHVHFDVKYNEDRVIEISVSTDPNQAVDITTEKDLEVDFTYSTKWESTETTFEHRMEKYQKYSFLPQHLEIHWFSIINSCVTVLLLTGFLATILMRVLKNDFIK